MEGKQTTRRTPEERRVVQESEGSIRWVMESGYSRAYAEDLVLRSERLYGRLRPQLGTANGK